MPGLVVSIVALAGATVFGLYWRVRNGRVVASADSQASASDHVRADGQGSDGFPDGIEPVTVGQPDRALLTSADIGWSLGDRATLLQFSSAFCAPCRATSLTLAEVAATVQGVAHVEIDAGSRLDLVRRLGVRRTPTTFVLGPDGHVTHRASGQPRKADVMAALGAVV